MALTALRNVIFFPGKDHTSQFAAGAHTLLQLLLVSSAHLATQKGETEDREFWAMNKDLTHKDKCENTCASFGKYSEVTDRA